MSLFVWTDTTAALRLHRSVPAELHQRSLEGGVEMSRQEITKRPENSDSDLHLSDALKSNWPVINLTGLLCLYID